MPYAVRDTQGRITSLHRHDPGVGELVEAGSAEVQAFLGLQEPPTGWGTAEFEQLDAEFVRVLEDLIDALARRGLINLTELPATAQNKLFARKSFRERRSPQALQLLGPTGGPEIV